MSLREIEVLLKHCKQNLGWEKTEDMFLKDRDLKTVVARFKKQSSARVESGIKFNEEFKTQI